MPHDHCPPSRRGHSWSKPEPVLLPEVPRRNLAELRICKRCGALGRINSQGIVVAATITEIKEALL